MKSELEINEYGDKLWRLPNGKLHREDGPAVEYSNGTKLWFINGEYHRKDGPALEWSKGDKEWFLNGIRHREDGPAIVNVDGYRAWFLDDKTHREDGPAIELPDGGKEWFLWDYELTETHVSLLLDESIDLDTRLGILRIELEVDNEEQT